MADTVYKTYKFRIYPSKAQIKIFEHTLDLCREVYNAALQERRDAWKFNRVFVTRIDQQKQLTELKTIREDLKEIHSHVLRSPLERLDITFNRYFKRLKKGEKAGYPRFKGKDNYNSFTYTQDGFWLRNNKLELSKIGKIKISLQREIIGKMKRCSVKRTSTNKWFVFFTVETQKDILELTNKSVGIDVGLTHFATLSNGKTISNPRFFKVDEKELAKAQRKLEKKDSKERYRRKKAVTKIHERIRNKRNNFAHQLSRNLVNNFDSIFFEDLRIKNLLQNKYLAKAIADAAWSQTIEFTTYKAENAGRLFALVNPRNTSQNCSKCGVKVEKSLSERTHNCLNCGLVMDRDLNAARNILTLGLQSLDLS